jgi:hypothetical protein
MTETPIRIGDTHKWITLSRDQVGQSDLDASHLVVWSLLVELHAEDVDARTSVWLGPDAVEEPLDEFYASLAADWRGWEGTRSWEAIEEGLALHCLNDGVSTARITAVLRQRLPVDWVAHVTLPVDLAQLTRIAEEMRALMTLD